jgi:preprotein translocase subunit SecB
MKQHRIGFDVEQSLNLKLPINARGFYDRAFQMLSVTVTKQSLRGADIVTHPDVEQTGVFDLSRNKQFFLVGLSCRMASYSSH